MRGLMSQPSRARDRSGYLSQDTIAAIATAVGGAISVIRLSGPDSFRALAALAPQARAAEAEPRKLYRARLTDSGGEIDDALFVRFVSPESFTGEDVVELHLHGGAFVASRAMEALERLGIRQALPGEFSFRAVRNGKMTLSQASAVADLIAASNENAVSLALEKMSGSQNQLVSGLASGIRKLAALGEVGIDFADQDVDEVSLGKLKNQLDPIVSMLERLQSGYDRGSRIQDGVGVAFIGLPNAGKSSFFNALLGEERSIVSSVPGTTRDVVRERLTLRGNRSSVTLRLEDTAGLRSAENEVEKIGILRSQKAAREADVILLLVDASAPTALALDEWKRLGSPASKTVGILTKSDLLDALRLAEIRETCQSFGLPHWVVTSAITGDGISEAVQTITNFCEKWVHRDRGEVLLTRLDQLRAVKGALEHLERARHAAEIDLFASDLRQALHALGPLIGETLPDDILGQIFSEFCIGK